MTTATAATVFERTFTMPASVERVFAALTNEKQLEQWWAEHAHVQPRAGGEYHFWGRYSVFIPTRQQANQVITRFEPPTLLAYRWNWRDLASNVELSLQVDGTNTVLNVRHTLDGVFPEFRYESREFLADLWIIAVGNLRIFLRTGKAASRPDYSIDSPNVECSILIDAPPDRVFAALTDPAKMDCWLSRTAKVELRPGGAYAYGWQLQRDGKPLHCGPTRIIAMEPNRRITHDWMHGEEPATRVTWTLEPIGSQTRVTILHERYAGKTVNDAYNQGWTGFLIELQSYIETGEILK